MIIQMWQKKLRIIAPAALIWTLGSCATDQAAKERKDKVATVGIWGAAYRPTANVGVVSDLSGAVTASTRHNHFDENGDLKSDKGEEPNSQNVKTRDSRKIDLGLHIYPSQTSAFFYGLAVNRRKEVTNFDSPNEGSSLSTPSFSNIEVSDDIYAAGPAVGWDWIWQNGVSVLLDLGPRWDVSKKRQLTDNSDASAKVDKAQRDKILKKLDNRSGIQVIVPRLIVGYSF